MKFKMILLAVLAMTFITASAMAAADHVIDGYWDVDIAWFLDGNADYADWEIDMEKYTLGEVHDDESGAEGVVRFFARRVRIVIETDEDGMCLFRGILIGRIMMGTITDMDERYQKGIWIATPYIED
ncbi:hypothetical protein GF312_10235 [Candidatus Poribacteria bacterium]|nr:hypothetical protein [Candidatus Poribacteria bacterium]